MHFDPEKEKDLPAKGHQLYSQEFHSLKMKI
jgi:hypothetical protein